MIIWSKGTKSKIAPALIPGIQRVNELKTLGVTIRSNLNFSDHVTNTLSSCQKTLYAFRILKTHGLSSESIYDIFKAAVLSKLLYCSQARFRYLLAADANRIEAFLSKSKRFNYYPSSAAFFKI